MKITTLDPSPELSHAVDQYWHCSVENLNSKGNLFPMLNHKIIFDYSDQVMVKWGEENCHTNGGNNLLFGLQTKPIQAIVQGRYESIGILLKLNGLYELFGLDASTYTNRAKNLLQVFNNDFKEVKFQIKREPEPVKKLEILDLFISRVSRYHRIDSDLTAFYEEINNVTIKQMQIGKYIKKIEKSHSTFIESFKKIYGTTPKQLILLNQINKSITNIVQTPEQPLVEIAIDSGFYDQAHFIKTFKRFTGILPSDYRKKVKNGGVMEMMPNFVSVN